MSAFSSRELLLQVRTRTLLRLLVVNRTNVSMVDDRTVPPLFVPDLRRFKNSKPKPAAPVPPVPAAKYESYKQMSFF